MSTKSILNRTSRKKRNDMLTVSNTSSIGSASALAVQPLNVTGNQPAFCIWAATAMDLTSGSNNSSNSVAATAARIASVCYMRGLSENVRIQTSTNIPWYWRRICFTTKDDTFVGTTNTSNYIDLASGGAQRMYENKSIAGQDAYVTQIKEVLFKGSEGLDWNDLIVAKVDTMRVSLKYDKLFTIRSGNDKGTATSRKFWHPMNKNLHYDDDETGVQMQTSYSSVTSKPGMGNYIIIDIIQPGAAGTASDIFRLQAEACLYWHEK